MPIILWILFCKFNYGMTKYILVFWRLWIV